MLTVDLPPDVQQFVHDEVARGSYRTPEELVIEAVRLLRDGSRRLEQFREQLQARVARLRQGQGIELEDDGALEKFFDAIEAELAEESVTEQTNS